MIPKVKPRPQARTRNTREVVRDMSRGQNTNVDPDKIGFDTFSDTQNMRLEGANLVMRNGTENLGDIEGLIDIYTHTDQEGTHLIGQVKNAGNSEFVLINEDDITTTTQLVASGDELGDMTSLFTRLYAIVPTDTKVFGTTINGTSFSVGAEGEHPTLIASNGERIWITTKEGVLRGSNTASAQASGQITTFAPSGTSTDRAVVASSQITKFTALATSGRVVCVCGENRTELHSTPDFTNAGIDIFPSNMNTMKDGGSFPDLGVKSRDAILAVGGNFWIKPDDDTLYRISPNGGLKKFRDNSGQMKKLKFDLAALAFDQRTNQLYISCRKGVSNDRVISFNILTEKFSYYRNVRAESWATAPKKVYFVKSLSNTLVRAFEPDEYTDEGSPIKFSTRTAFSFGDSIDLVKKAEEAYINFIHKEQYFEGVMRLVVGRMGGEYSEVWRTKIKSTEYSNPFMDSAENFYNGAPGSPELDYEKELFTEYVKTDIKIRKKYYRAALEFTGSTNNEFVLRGLGFSSSISSGKLRTKIYN